MSTHSLRVLLVDDDDAVRQLMAEFIRLQGHSVAEASDGLQALQLAENSDFQIAFIDIRMPGLDGISLLAKLHDLRPALQVAIFTGYGTMELAVRSFRLGALDFLQKPVTQKQILAVLENVEVPGEDRDKESSPETTGTTPADSRKSRVPNQLIGTSTALNLIRQRIRLVSQSHCEAIIINGETGTGKEVVAHEIHRTSPGDTTPFVAISCPALTDTLVESELFGHMKGAFTGATRDRSGYFELAGDGTLFLDEIGDLSWVAQAKLLRVLETRRFRPVGAASEKKCRARIIAATNRPLEDMIRAGTFRPDLFYRLQVFSITVPPLREHMEDIEPLTRYFAALLSETRQASPITFSRRALLRLHDHQYPGNVRELRNIVERAVTLSERGVIHEDMIIFNQGTQQNGDENLDEPWNHRERELIIRTLERLQWNRRKTSELLGIPYSTLRYKIKRYKIREKLQR